MQFNFFYPVASGVAALGLQIVGVLIHSTRLSISLSPLASRPWGRCSRRRSARWQCESPRLLVQGAVAGGAHGGGGAALVARWIRRAPRMGSDQGWASTAPAADPRALAVVVEKEARPSSSPFDHGGGGGCCWCVQYYSILRCSWIPINIDGIGLFFSFLEPERFQFLNRHLLVLLKGAAYWMPVEKSDTYDRFLIAPIPFL